VSVRGRLLVAAVGVVALTTATAGTAGTASADPAPARSAAAAGCDGVRVVVDYNELGGADRTACAAPGTAAEVFDAAGFALEFVPQQPGFVCRVTGLPESGPCFDGDAYWSLWWSDGDAEWTYATLGVTALEVPAGGLVGFAWHEGDGDAAPPDAHSVGTAAGDDASGVPEPATDDEGGVPGWTLGLVALVVLAAAAVPLLRRRRA
jgi:hypothetical protein